MRRLVAECLSDAGFAVCDADGGEQVAQMREHFNRLDVVFADIQCRRVVGSFIAARARQRYPGMPVNYASGRPGILINQTGVSEAVRDDHCHGAWSRGRVEPTHPRDGKTAQRPIL
jgi:CheY-like chemotaxis protein